MCNKYNKILCVTSRPTGIFIVVILIIIVVSCPLLPMSSYASKLHLQQYEGQIRRNGFCNYRIFTKYFLIKYFELLSYNKCKQIKIHQRRFKLVYACRRHTVPPVYASMLKSIHCGAAIRLRHAFLWDIDMGCMR